MRFPSTVEIDGNLKKYLANKLKTIISIDKTDSDLSALRIKIMLLEIILELYENQLFGELQTSVKEKQENKKK